MSIDTWTPEPADTAFTPEPAPAPEPVVKTRPKKPRAAKPRTNNGRTPTAVILEGIRLARELSDKPESEVIELADLYRVGADSDVDHLAAAIAAGRKPDTKAVDFIVGCRTLDPFEAGITAHQLTEKPGELKRVWTVLARHSDLPAEPSKTSVEAAKTVATTINTLDQTVLDMLQHLTDNA